MRRPVFLREKNTTALQPYHSPPHFSQRGSSLHRGSQLFLLLFSYQVQFIYLTVKRNRFFVMSFPRFETFPGSVSERGKGPILNFSWTFQPGPTHLTGRSHSPAPALPLGTEKYPPPKHYPLHKDSRLVAQASFAKNVLSFLCPDNSLQVGRS